MIDTFANLSSKPAIWICLQPPANNSSWSILDTTIKNQINPKIKEVALTKGVNMIDLYTELNKGRWNWFLSTDTVHLNVTGIKKMAAYIYNLMKADT
jgi:lysophospholipase L1-like esterase